MQCYVHVAVLSTQCVRSMIATLRMCLLTPPQQLKKQNNKNQNDLLTFPE